MARSAKTDHVMNLVGAEPVKRMQPHVQEGTASAPAMQQTAKVDEPAEAEKHDEIKAVVLEVINQELGSVAKRFHLQLNDSNLWELTRAALEDVRPVFSFDSDELAEKSERIRAEVIKAMTKTAVKLKVMNN